jgi:phospholipid/cholesterol/gamma-HCH transport system substrate-binding protein
MKSMVLGPMVDPAIRAPGILFRRSIAAVVVAAVLSSLVLAYGKGMFFDRVQVSAVVDDAGGALTPGSDVKSRGVIIGEVTSIDTDGDRVRIGLNLTGKHARNLPSDVKARVLPATVFGTTFVDLTAPGDSATSAVGLRQHQVIQQDTSVKTVELQDALDSTDRVLSAINPAELSTTLSRVASAVRGRGSELGDTLETLDSYLARLEPHLPLLQEDLRLLGINLHVLADTSPDLLKALDDSLTTTRTITDKRRQFATSLTQAHGLVDTADEFLRKQKKQVVVTLANTAVTFDALYDYRHGLPGGFQSFVTFGERASQGFSDGPYLHTDVFIKTGADVPYSRADCPHFGSAQGDNCDGAAGTSEPTQAPSGAAPLLPLLPAPVTTPGGQTGAENGLLGRIAQLLGNAGGGR